MKKVLLQTCCAPCSAAILEYLQLNNIEVGIYFYNPNIFPESEYLHRKDEVVKYAIKIGIPIIDEDGQINTTKCAYSNSWKDKHAAWKEKTIIYKDEPERGKRCQLCFDIRMENTAKYASEHGYDTITTALASSRWKDLKQVSKAGFLAASHYKNVEYWDKNWRKEGLFERRNILAKQFYNQQYCGCEFGLENQEKWRRNHPKTEDSSIID
ncbi:MAG: epoxyqueuosine reductase QueH [Bacteroidales bacterium]